MSGDDLKAAVQNAHKYDLGIIAAGVLTFVFSFLPYYTVSVKFAALSGSDSVTAWHGFFGWFAVLLVLAAAVLLVLPMLNVNLNVQMPVRTVVLGLFAAAMLCLVIAFFVIPGGDCQGIKACEDAIDFGHGVGYWLSFIVVAGGLALAYLRKDAKD